MILAKKLRLGGGEGLLVGERLTNISTLTNTAINSASAVVYDRDSAVYINVNNGVVSVDVSDNYNMAIDTEVYGGGASTPGSMYWGTNYLFLAGSNIVEKWTLNSISDFSLFDTETLTGAVGIVSGGSTMYVTQPTQNAISSVYVSGGVSSISIQDTLTDSSDLYGVVAMSTYWFDGDNVAIARGSSKLTSIDVSDVYNLSIIDSSTLSGDHEGRNAMIADGGHAFIRGESGLSVYTINVDGTFTFRNSIMLYSLGPSEEGVIAFLPGNTTIITSVNGTLQTVDIRDLDNLVILSEVTFTVTDPIVDIEISLTNNRGYAVSEGSLHAFTFSL